MRFYCTQQNEPYLPSPLCDKELEEVVELDFEEFDDDLSNILHTANLDRWTGGGTVSQLSLDCVWVLTHFVFFAKRNWEWL